MCQLSCMNVFSFLYFFKFLVVILAGEACPFNHCDMYYTTQSFDSSHAAYKTRPTYPRLGVGWMRMADLMERSILSVGSFRSEAPIRVERTAK